ncbi:integrase core domain-containing protein [Vulcaniibacterium thermophilum]
MNEHWFTSLAQARNVIAEWRRDYNEVRPHSSCGRIPPAQFAANHRTQTHQAEVPFTPGSPSNWWYGYWGQVSMFLSERKAPDLCGGSLTSHGQRIRFSTSILYCLIALATSFAVILPSAASAAMAAWAMW